MANEERAAADRGMKKAPLQYRDQGQALPMHKRLATGNKVTSDPFGKGAISKTNEIANDKRGY